MAAGVAEIDPAATVSGVDLAWSMIARVGPVLQPAGLDLAVDHVEVVLRDQEGVMLRSDFLPVGHIGIVEVRAVLDRDGHEVAERHRTRESEQLGEKFRGLPLIAGGDDGVVELDRHCACQSTTLGSASQCPSATLARSAPRRCCPGRGTPGCTTARCP